MWAATHNALLSLKSSLYIDTVRTDLKLANVLGVIASSLLEHQ
jgi:hypothetical protein